MRWRLKSPASPLFTQPFIQAHIKENIKSSASLAFVRGIRRWALNSPYKGPVTRKMFPFDDVLMQVLGTFTMTNCARICGDKWDYLRAEWFRLGLQRNGTGLAEGYSFDAMSYDLALTHGDKQNGPLCANDILKLMLLLLYFYSNLTEICS